jgi:phosphonate transport system permease protein
MGLGRNGWLILLAALIMVSAVHTGFNPSVLAAGWPNLGIILSEMMALDMAQLSRAFLAIIETLEMALLGTAVGFLLALPLSLLAARNIAHPYIALPIRACLILVRTIPSLLWALLFVVVMGLGAPAGIMALAMYSLGFMGKMFYETFESQNPEAYEALAVVGASRLQVVRFVTLPEAAPHILNQLLFMFEYNVRASTILGFVGAGGIGFYILNYLQLLEYGRAFTYLLVVLATVLAMDWLSMKIRAKYIPNLPAARIRG